MTNGNDPNDDAGNRAADYAADHVDSQLAEMDLEELCEEFDIGLADGLEIFDAHNGWMGLWTFWMSVLGSLHCDRYEYIVNAAAALQMRGGVSERFDAMLCAAIRQHEPYRQQVSEKLPEQHRAGEVGDWSGQDDAEERATIPTGKGDNV